MVTLRSPGAIHRTQTIRRWTRREPPACSRTHPSRSRETQRPHLPQQRPTRLDPRAQRDPHEHPAASPPVPLVRSTDRRYPVLGDRTLRLGITIFQTWNTARLSVAPWLFTINLRTELKFVVLEIL